MSLIFGQPLDGVEYSERRAAYVVILNGEGRVAMVNDNDKWYLPGGGTEGSETPEETARREVCEELARNVRLTRVLGRAVQYYYSSADERHYRMEAAFFSGELTDEPVGGTPEHELRWVTVDEAQRECFHACHAWIITQALTNRSEPPAVAGGF
ncbi:MAG TPA: NUDIX hydrolase [Pyrinomonadaceae bacterium]|nr:NUDIX hydrolase [Pyrinomonadaceae bacterium]